MSFYTGCRPNLWHFSVPGTSGSYSDKVFSQIIQKFQITLKLSIYFTPEFENTTMFLVLIIVKNDHRIQPFESKLIFCWHISDLPEWSNQRSRPPGTIPPAEANRLCLRKWVRSGKHAVTHPQYSPIICSDLRFRDYFINTSFKSYYLHIWKSLIGFTPIKLSDYIFNIYKKVRFIKSCSNEYNSKLQVVWKKKLSHDLSRFHLVFLFLLNPAEKNPLILVCGRLVSE